MRVLLITNQDTGLEYYRLTLPHQAMVRNSGAEVMYQTPTGNTKETFREAFDSIGDDELKTFDICVFLRLCTDTGLNETDYERCRRLGVKIVFDIDDYWNLPPDHLLKSWTDKNIHKIKRWIREADLVTTTTKYFANVIEEETGVKAHVLPNCVEPLAEQFMDITPTQTTRRVRYGWIGGAHHKVDLQLMEGAFKYFAKKRDNDIQFCLGGFTVNSQYIYIERLMTDNYKAFAWDRTYIDYLKQMTPLMEHYGFFKPYRRLWAGSVYNYAKLYNEVDVCLVPLRENRFACCKSELKLIEAGHFKKPVIVSDAHPYNELIEDGVNGFIATNWTDEIKELKDPELRKQMGEALNKTVSERFDINQWSKKRHGIYQELADK